MSAYEEGVVVLEKAAQLGNKPAQAVLNELQFRQTRIDALHELNSELNARLREARLELAKRPAGWSALFAASHVDTSDNGADPMEHLTHAND